MLSLFNNFNLSATTIYILIAIGVILAMLIGYAYYTHLRISNTTYNANHESGKLSGEEPSKNATLMLFFADWCPHCKTAKPEWNSMKEEYEGKEINGYVIEFKEYDCSGENNPEIDELMNTYDVSGYPTIKLAKDNEIITFDANPTKNLMTTFLTTVL